MLLKSNISDIEIYSKEWRASRRGRFTASNWYKLMGDKTAFMNYVRSRVYEELSDDEDDDGELMTKAIMQGIEWEPLGINAFMQAMNLTHVVTQKLICVPGSKFGCTPDLIIPIQESQDKTMWMTEVGEVKCYQGVHHIEMCECETPEDIFKINKKMFWQLIMQMHETDSLVGWAVFYNPKMKVSKLKIIKFRKVELREYFKEFEKKKAEALAMFEKIRTKLLMAA